MKKIAFILALVMVFAVALVACDETPAESSNPAESTPAESTPAESTPDEESVPAESTPDESEPEEESKLPPAEVGELISGGLEYVISEQFRQGGSDVNWGYDPNADIAYPDEGGTLTDGVTDTEATENVYADAIWAGFSANAPTYPDYGYNFITINLGETKNIAEMAIYLGSSALANGIGVSNSTVQFFVSDDGENWTEASEVISPVDDETVNVIKVSAGMDVNAQYVQVRFVRDGWLFVSEVEVYAAK